MSQKLTQKYIQEDFLVHKQASQQASTGNVMDSKEKIAGSGIDILNSSKLVAQYGSYVKILEASKNGKVKLRAAWRGLAIEYPNWLSRLAILAYLIDENAISMLPTPTARDWRSPGRQDHPRLNGSRGLPLPEDLGSQVHPELLEALMDYPIGWTDLNHSEMP